MSSNDPIRMMSSEFNLWGVKFTHQKCGSGHFELRWQASPDKEVRTQVIAATPSDHRWFMNERAALRRAFKQDGLVLKEQIKKKPAAIVKALQVPEPVETDSEQIKMLRAEVVDLTSVVLHLGRRINRVLSLLTSATASTTAAEGTSPAEQIEQTEHVEPVPALPVPPIEPIAGSIAIPVYAKQQFRGTKAIDHVTANWNSTDSLAKAMNVPRNIAYRKLYYLQGLDLVENDGDRWRRKPSPVKIMHARVKRAPHRRASGHRASL